MSGSSGVDGGGPAQALSGTDRVAVDGLADSDPGDAFDADDPPPSVVAR